MRLESTLEAGSTLTDVTKGTSPTPWWTRPEALASNRHETARPQLFRLADAVLQLESDVPELVRYFADHYGECRIDAAGAEADSMALTRVRCRVYRADDQLDVLSARFDAPSGIDAFALALAFMKHPADAPRYVEDDDGAAQDSRGWRFVLEVATGIPVVGANGVRALLDSSRVSMHDLAGLIVNAVLGIQRELLFLHAASLGVRGRGVLLIGPSHSGKTTTALTLASRGHMYFGDDVAAIRSATGDLMPFWRTAHIRPGPHARALSGQLASGQWDPPYRDGLPRLRIRVADLFAQPTTGCAPLRTALFLRGFAKAPDVQYFEPTFASLGGRSRFALNNTLWVAWGTTPARRLMQFMIFLRLLSRVRCAWLDVGEPEATADLIENTLEETCASP